MTPGAAEAGDIPRLNPGQYFGQTVRRCSLNGLVLVESRYAPDTRIPAHVHDGAFFYFVLEGGVDESSGAGTRQVGPGGVVYHPAGEMHANHWRDTGGRCFHVELSAVWFERIGCRPDAFTGRALPAGGMASWLASRICAESRSGDTAAPLAIEGLTLALLAETARREPVVGSERRTPAWLVAARDLLEADLSVAVSLEEMAARVGVHPAHLARSFRRHYGASLGEYVRRRRIEVACAALSATEAPIADIALGAGFFDQSHFCRTFLRYTGLSPSAYRRLYRAGNSRTTT